MATPRHITIIAEAGVNHNGDMATAKRLIDAAADAGADYVKFQTFKSENLVASNAALAEYQKKNTGNSHQSQYDMLKKLELTRQQHYELIDYCNRRHIKFLTTAFDLDSLDFVASLNLGVWKIPSGEITNYPYLRRMARYGGKVLLSTGMCEMQDIYNAIAVLETHGINHYDITILHCNTEYPTPMRDVNLAAMATLRERFCVETGYSDHTVGIEVPIAAAVLGATVIEKHITLDRSLPGPDQKASLEPAELKTMVQSIRNIEMAIGDGEKHVTESERKNIAVARKSIVAATKIKKGEILTDDNICAKRPGNGISPMKWPEVIGTRAVKDYQPDEPIVI